MPLWTHYDTFSKSVFCIFLLNCPKSKQCLFEVWILIIIGWLKTVFDKAFTCWHGFLSRVLKYIYHCIHIFNQKDGTYCLGDFDMAAFSRGGQLTHSSSCSSKGLQSLQISQLTSQRCYISDSFTSWRFNHVG